MTTGHTPGTGAADGGRDDVEAQAATLDGVALLVALRCLERVPLPRQVRMTGMVRRPGGGWSRADRCRVVAALGTGALAVVDGAVVEEVTAGQRWLAWFPRPVGPHHAVNMPSPVVGELHDRDPDLQLVRAHLAVRSWQAELLQAMGNLAATQWGLARLQRWAAHGAPGPPRPSRWACVVEVVDVEGMLVRGWAYGSDRADAATMLAGTGAPAATGTGSEAADVLDELMAADGLRWSVGQPTPIGG